MKVGRASTHGIPRNRCGGTQVGSHHLAEPCCYGSHGPCLSPGGRIENSPAVYCRVHIRNASSPEGTAEFSERHAAAPVPIFEALIQPSLRDLDLAANDPGVETPGYSHDVPSGQMPDIALQ